MNTETAIPVTPSDSTEPFVPAPTGRTACVVGAGFGGLAEMLFAGERQEEFQLVNHGRCPAFEIALILSQITSIPAMQRLGRAFGKAS